MGSKTYKLEIENEEYYNLENELYQSDEIFLIYDLGRNGSMDYEYKNLTLSGKYFTNLFKDLRAINENVEVYTNKLNLLIEDKEKHLLDDKEWYEDKREEYEEKIEEYAQEYRDTKEDWLKLQEEYHIFDLYAYVHSGVSFSISCGYPYNCQWDSSQCGFVFIRKLEVPDSNEAEKMAKNNVEYLNSLSSGEVYQIQLFEITKCECCNKENEESVESLGMIVGSNSLKKEIEYILQENKIEEKDVINLKELKEEWYL